MSRPARKPPAGGEGATTKALTHLCSDRHSLQPGEDLGRWDLRGRRPCRSCAPSGFLSYVLVASFLQQTLCPLCQRLKPALELGRGLALDLGEERVGGSSVRWATGLSSKVSVSQPRRRASRPVAPPVKGSSRRSGQGTACPPDVERGDVAVADGFLAGGLGGDGFEGEGDFD